jgi:Zn-finger nucleic acid-binding protein
MECPVCKVTLLMSDKQGIEIDYCPTCRGIWLDRGELEKIIERSYAPENVQDRPVNPAGGVINQPFGYDHHDSHGYKHGRKRNMWSDLFD